MLDCALLNLSVAAAVAEKIAVPALVSSDRIGTAREY
jgi:hypothetical protein